MAKAGLALAERVEAERRAAVEAPAKRKRLASSSRQKRKRKSVASKPRGKPPHLCQARCRGAGPIRDSRQEGEGLKKIIDACGGSQQAFQLLMLEHLDGLAKTAAQAISNIKFDKVIVWEGATATVTPTAPTTHQLPAKHGPLDAAHDADHERHRRRRAARIHREVDAGKRAAGWQGERRCNGDGSEKVTSGS